MFYAGSDLSLKETSICVVDDATHKAVKEVKVGTEHETIAVWLEATGFCLEKVGLEAASLAPALRDGLAAAGFPVVVLDARHRKLATHVKPVTTDRIVARNAAAPSRNS